MKGKTMTSADTYAEQMTQYQQDLAVYQAKAQAAMAEAGVKIGDHVEYHALGSWNSADVFEGTLYVTKRGEPRVRLAVGYSRRSMRWHKGFRGATR